MAKINPLPFNQPIVDTRGMPTNYFLRQWIEQLGVNADGDTTLAELEAQIVAIQGTSVLAGTGLDGGGLIGDGDITLDMADTAVTPGTYGDATNIPTITIDQQGRITAASETAITGASFDGALVNKSSGSQSGTAIAVSFDTATFDTNSFWSAGSPTRLTVPTGVSYVEVSGAFNWSGGTANLQAYMQKNGASFVGRPRLTLASGFSDGYMNITSGPLAVSSGDYFELVAAFSASRTVGSNDSTWFSIKVLE